MTTEQKEAIEYLEESVLIYKNTLPKISKAIETVLNLIQEQEAELQKKDQIIDELAKAFKQDDARSVEEIKQYFERKVEDEKI